MRCKTRYTIWPTVFDIAAKGTKAAELREKTLVADFWSKPEEAQALMQQLTTLQSEVQEWQDLIRQADEMVEMYEMASSEAETSVLEDIGAEAAVVAKQLAALRLRTLMSG